MRERPVVTVVAALAAALSLLLAPPIPAVGEQSGSEHRRVAAAAVAVGDAHSCVLTTQGQGAVLGRRRRRPARLRKHRAGRQHGGPGGRG